jgi:hypothetical protein
MDVNCLIFSVAAFHFKINYLHLGGAFSSQCGGQEFDPPLLHQLFQELHSQPQGWLFLFMGHTNGWACPPHLS